MRSLVLAVTLVVFQAGPAESVCYLGNCRASNCNGYRCTRCKDTFYLDTTSQTWRDNCKGCPSSCSVCEGYKDCSECNTGRYGYRCQSYCMGCNQNICDRDDGSCTNGCIAGYYRETDGRCSQCPPGCSQCSDSITCSDCKEVYNWGATCQYTCYNCPSCSKFDGCSSGCYSGYYRLHDTNMGGYQCLKCPGTCTSCSAVDNCLSCSSGYWGKICHYTCPATCASCTSNSYCQSCKPGHWGTTCGNSCPNVCEACTADTACSICKSDYWGSKCQHSCSGCYGNTCSKSQGCTSGCIDGYFRDTHWYGYWEYRCYRCLDVCETCANSVSCSTCPPGFVGTKCEHDCQACNGQVCDINTGVCTYICASNEYFRKHSGDTGCFSCPYGCSRCSSASQCTMCATGKWGTTCGIECPVNCNNNECDKNLGICSGGCITGYFSRNNNDKCECNANKCSRTEGTVCQECFEDTWYPELKGCCPCSTNCKDNTCSTDGTCFDCIDGKYGTKCESNCLSKCKDNLCYRNSSCIACNNAYYHGPTCDSHCLNSISRCDTCNGLSRETAICTSCWKGWYADGHKCKECSAHCISGANPKCDPSTGACNGYCETRWFGERCNINCNVTNCQTCSSEDPNICSECSDGFFSATNSSCKYCPDNCLMGTLCSKHNGSCIGGCDDNWSGDQCVIPCPSSCRTCDQFNKSSCSLCKEESYGHSCENTCSSGCVAKHQSQTCEKSSGTCNLDCKEGFWDNLCDKRCGKGCSGNVCNRTIGNCLSQCNDTHFGPMCDRDCSENCLNTTGRYCDETDGNCIDGCELGWFGKQCNEECSQNCKERICDRNNGSCTSGCIDGYTGSICSQALLSDDHAGSNAAAIGGGAGAGVAVLVIIVVIVVVVVLRRRKTSSKMETRNDRSVEKKHSFKQTEPAGPEYSNISEARIEKKGSEIRGITNRLYANTLVRMSDVSEKEEVTNGNSTKVRPTSEDYLKEVELDDDDKVDDDEADAAGRVDDTYYNIGGQRIAVAKLAEYIKQKAKETLLNDFEKIPKGLLKSYKEAKKSKNATKNKYRAIYPYDENRVVLLGGGGDYMNASYIDGYNRSKEYIASSGPFERSYDTTSDFWRMISQERCETLVMLTKPFEDGQAKCTKYWPDADESCRYGDINIACLTEDVYADFTIRILTVKKGEESLNIRHVHFTAWPDKGIPHDVTSMIELRQKVRSLHKDKECPMIVHCSAGIGRTGTFIVLDMLTYEGEDRGSVDIYGSVASLRYQRCNMVQTPEQYVYLHHAVLHSLTFDCRSIPGDMFLQNYNKLIDRNGGERIIDKQFQQLQSITEEQTDEDRAQIEKNKTLSNKNRKGADIPADESRVKLHENRKPGASDYINAVYVNSFRKKRKFICAQTPLSTTVVDFLSLIHQERCSCVVSMEEPDIQDKTLKVYWPADNQVVKHGVFKVCCKDSKTTAHYVTKKLTITYHGPNGEESRDVNLYIFTNWSKDSLVPKTSDSLLELVKTVDAMNRTSEYEAPVLIHCRTGAERSCLYCAVSVLIEKMEIEHEVSVVNTLRQIKARRLSAISSVEQYKFCHQAVIGYLQSFDIYSNFGLKDADA